MTAMRRPLKSSTNRLSADAQRLITLAKGVAQSSSRIEERQWETILDQAIEKHLKAHHQTAFDGALEHLFNTDLAAYDALLDAIEAGCESCVIEHEDKAYNALLIAIPILAWTRYAIPAGPIHSDVQASLLAHLHGHVLADGCRLALSPQLFSIDQLPRSHVQTYALTHTLAAAAVAGNAAKLASNKEETAPFLADTRYLLAACAAPVGTPLFQWQTDPQHQTRTQILKTWQTQAGPIITPLLPGCGIELLLPEAYFIACREADMRIRPASIRAAVHYICHTLDVESSGLRAVIGGFTEDPTNDRVDEYRIGFTMRHDNDVIYGVVWPLFGDEDELDTISASSFEALTTPELLEAEARAPIDEITALLRECGITHIKRHNELFPSDFCDDCNAPLYPDPEGEVVHAEMPEDAAPSPGHFH